MRFILAFFCLLTVSTAQAASIIKLQSEPGDAVGGGVDHELSIDYVAMAEDFISLTSGGEFDFNFSPLSAAVFSSDTSYGGVNHLDLPHAEHPGMLVRSWLSSPNCDVVTGAFHIYEFDLASTSNKLALDFVQYCDSDTAALHGQIRINSDVPIPAPLPLAIVNTKPSSLREGEILTLDGSQSFIQSSITNSFHWEQLSGPDVVIADPSAQQTTAWMPTGLPLGGVDVSLRLTVTDDFGASDSTDLSVHVASKSDPETYLKLRSESGDYIGEGLDWSFTRQNATFTMNRNFDNGIHIEVNNGTSWWFLDFADPFDSLLSAGNYPEASRWPFQALGSAGLDISGDGRGCNQSSGSFDVNAIHWENNYPLAFRAEFTQYCENMGAALTGEVAVNAVPASVPHVEAGDDIDVYEGQIVNLNGSDTFDSDGTMARLEWSAPGVDGLQILHASETRASFTAPTLNNREASRTLLLTLWGIDNEGYQAEDTVRVRVLANNQPPVAVDDTATVDIGVMTELFPLVNDTDTDGSVLTDSIQIVKYPEFGFAVVRSSGVIEYQPWISSPALDTLQYTIKDNDGGVSQPATITLGINQPGSLSLSLKAMLQGPYEPELGLMRGDLRQRGLLPLQQPYASSPVQYAGNETTTVDILAGVGADAPVDWVLVGLQDQANPGADILWRAALLQRDGDIVDPASNSSILSYDGAMAGNYVVTLYHRNHLAVTSAQPVTLGETPVFLDFSATDTAVMGTHTRFDSGNGMSLLWAGDIDRDGRIIATGPGNDIQAIIGKVLTAPANALLNSNYVLTGYDATDLNLDGRTILAGAGNDAQVLLANVLLHPANASLAANFVIRGE